MHRTTLAIEDRIVERIREKAAAESRTFQECANEILLLGLEVTRRPAVPPPPLPVFSMGAPGLDLADRDALEEAMKEG